MTTTTAWKTERTIGLWLDAIGDPGNPRWIVSRDREAHDGTMTSITVRTFRPDDIAGAREFAMSRASREGKPLVQTDAEGRRIRLWEPEPSEVW